jgi:hypothetical protein
MQFYNPWTDEILNEGDENDHKLIPLGNPYHNDENSSMKDGIQFAWDNTSLGWFKTCPRKYHFHMIQGWTYKVMPPPLAFGIYIHRLFQTWHQLLASDMDKTECLLRCVKLAGLLGEKLPKGDTARQKEQLVRAFVWYVEQFWDDPAKTVILSDGTPAVEYSFTLPFFEHNGEQVFLCGHIDRYAEWQGKVMACDYKSTKYGLDRRFFDKFKPNGQFATYASVSHIIAAETHDLPSADGLMLDAVQLGVNFNRYQRQVIPFSLEEVDEHIKGMTFWITRAREASEEGYFPANEESCGNYGGCEFREICSKAPARRQDYLRGHFVKKVWDPLRSR